MIDEYAVSAMPLANANQNQPDSAPLRKLPAGGAKGA